MFSSPCLQHAQQGSAEWAVEEEEFSQARGTTWTSSITTAGAGGSNFPQYQQGLTYFKCSQTTLSPLPIHNYILRHFPHGQFGWKSLFFLKLESPKSSHDPRTCSLGNNTRRGAAKQPELGPANASSSW